jgi:uroporphyrinogen-III decarboxylase
VTGKERLLAALRGQEVDRPPIWLREGFNIGGDIRGEPLQNLKGLEAKLAPDFCLGWKDDSLYRELFEFVDPVADTMVSWNIGEHINRFLVIPPGYIHREVKQVDDRTLIVDGTIETPRGVLTFKDKLIRGINTFWRIEYPVSRVEDLKDLAALPFTFAPEALAPYLDAYRHKLDALGERGILQIGYPSPIVAISGTMSLENFLALSAMEKDLFHELLQEITARLLTITDALFSDRQLETIVNFGGAEQCTPPLMRPEAFDEFVVPYDGRIIARLKSYNIPVNMHCHGKVRHALECMKRMGVDSTDPVEPPPGGDLSYAEARAIAAGELTLVGNLEFDELATSTAGEIKKRILEMARFGSRRLILAASAGPISTITPKLAENYKAWIDTALQYFG